MRKEPERPPLVVVAGLPVVNNRWANSIIEQGLASLPRGRSGDVILTSPRYDRKPGAPDTFVDEVSETILFQAKKTGHAVNVSGISAGGPVAAAAIKKIGREGIAGLVGIAAPMKLGDPKDIPPTTLDRVRNYPAYLEFMEHEYIPEIASNLSAMDVPSLSLYGKDDDSIPVEMSTSWANETVHVTIPPFGTDPRLSVRHAAVVIKSLRNPRFREFTSLDRQAV